MNFKTDILNKACLCHSQPPSPRPPPPAAFVGFHKWAEVTPSIVEFTKAVADFVEAPM